jgi:hypothetical protein
MLVSRPTATNNLTAVVMVNLKGRKSAALRLQPSLFGPCKASLVTEYSSYNSDRINQVTKVDTKNHCLPQARNRGYIIGIRRDCLPRGARRPHKAMRFVKSCQSPETYVELIAKFHSS